MFLRDLPVAAKNALILIGGMLLIFFLYTLSSVIAPFLVSVVLAYILNPLIRFLEKYRIPRPWAVLSLYVFAIFIGILFVVPVTLNVISSGHDLLERLSKIDVNQLSHEYKAQGRELFEKYSQIPWVKKYLEVSLNNEKVQELFAKGIVFVKDLFLGFLQKLFSFTLSAFSGFMGFFLIPLVTFYVLVDLDLLYQRGILLIPAIYRTSTERVASKIDVVLSAFLRGQVISCVAFASLMTIGLWLVGLNFSVLLGPIAGVANLVPYLGGLVTIILSFLVALSQFGVTQELSYSLGKIALMLIIVQKIDSFVLQPQVLGGAAGLHPLAVILALILGGSLFGLLGMILAIPATCILKVISIELYHELYDPV